MDKENQDLIPTDRTNATLPVTAPLNTLLQRLGAARANPPPKEITPLPSNVRHLPTKFPREEITPATPEQIIALVRTMEIIYPLPSLSEQERSERYQIFCADLSRKPIQDLARAWKRYRTSRAKFFPTTGQILDLCGR